MDEPRRLADEEAEELVAGESGGEAPGVSGRELAASLLIHGLLAGRQAEPEKALAAIRLRLGARERLKGRRRLLWAGAVAAGLILGAALSLLLPPRKPTIPPGALVVSGSPEGLEAGAARVPLGRRISAGKAPVTLACSDKSLVELAPGSSLTLHGRKGGDRWRLALDAGAVQCEVPRGEQPFRVCTRAGDVVTEGTRFGVRLAAGGDARLGLAVSVAEGRVRVERPPLGSVAVPAGALRLFPAPAASGEGALLALRLLFPGEAVQGVTAKLDGPVIEIEGKIGDLEVEAKVAPDGLVQSHSRELPPAGLPAAVRAAVRARYGPDAQWVEAELEVRGGSTAYEVTLRVKGKEVEERLDPDGNFIRKEDSD